MTLNKMPIGGIFCRFDTGEFMFLLSNADGVFQLENEFGQSSTICKSDAADIFCIQVGDKDLLSQFNRNAALGRALYNADKTATRILRESSQPDEEYEGALGVRKTVNEQISHLQARIERTRTARSLGLNAARVFLYDLAQKEEHKGTYLGHTVSYTNANTVMIDNHTYTTEVAQRILAETKPKPITFSLQSLLQSAHNRFNPAPHNSLKHREIDLVK